MFPIRDELPSRGTPWIRNFIILVNVGVFLYTMRFSPHVLEQFFEQFGFVGKNFASDPGGNFYSFITYQFLHGGFGHIIGNMWYLWIFGDNVESKLGHFKFLIFYFISGIFSCMTQLVVVPHLNVPLVGASGSIAGVLGAYAAFYPRARVVTWIPFGLFGWVTKVRAWYLLIFWFLYQFILGAFTYNPYYASTTGGVAWWAHIGGFVFGLFYGFSMK